MIGAPHDLILEEVSALAMQVKVVTASEDCYLTPRQDEWAFDLVNAAERQDQRLFTPRAIDFMWQIVRGDYAVCRG